MNKNYLISTGGSGGHVIPATILYEHLIKERNVIISCDKRGLKYLEKNYEYKIIDTPKLNNILFLPINLIIIFVLTVKSFFLLKTERIEKPRNRYALLLLIPQFSKKLKIDITAITQ